MGYDLGDKFTGTIALTQPKNPGYTHISDRTRVQCAIIYIRISAISPGRRGGCKEWRKADRTKTRYAFMSFGLGD